MEFSFFIDLKFILFPLYYFFFAAPALLLYNLFLNFEQKFVSSSYEIALGFAAKT